MTFLEQNLKNVASYAFLYVAIDITGVEPPIPLHIHLAPNGAATDEVIEKIHAIRKLITLKSYRVHGFTTDGDARYM